MGVYLEMCLSAVMRFRERKGWMLIFTQFSWTESYFKLEGPCSTFISFIGSCESEYNGCCLGFICHKYNSLLSSAFKITCVSGKLLYYQTNFLMSSSYLHDTVTLIEYFRWMPNFQIVKIWNSFKIEKIKEISMMMIISLLDLSFSPNAKRNNLWKTRSGSFCALVT